mmetsp:Transcript_131033/g.184720  ORF Transcript_131033/g.184720 Transcript_131033/m.184720 type:complete len:265 (+) Transcript_131033:3-797(+)
MAMILENPQIPESEMLRIFVACAFVAACFAQGSTGGTKWPAGFSPDLPVIPGACQCQKAKSDAQTRYGPRCKLDNADMLRSFIPNEPWQPKYDFGLPGTSGAEKWKVIAGSGTKSSPAIIVTLDGRWVCCGMQLDINTCGDGKVQAGEQCDANATITQTCKQINKKFEGGGLSCTKQCKWDTSNCFTTDKCCREEFGKAAQGLRNLRIWVGRNMAVGKKIAALATAAGFTTTEETEDDEMAFPDSVLEDELAEFDLHDIPLLPE